MRDLKYHNIKLPSQRRKYQEGEGTHSVVVVLFYYSCQPCLTMDKLALKKKKKKIPRLCNIETNKMRFFSMYSKDMERDCMMLV